MSSFYIIALFSALLVHGVFGEGGNWLRKETPTTTEPAINYRAHTYAITTERHEDESTMMTTVRDYKDSELEKLKEERRYQQDRWKRHREFAGNCMLKKYVKIQDEFGCEMCTCIYEKSIMLCSPYECQSKPILYELGETVYNDYIIHVETNFSEYECTPGEVLLPTPICECTCVAKNILSCPSTCRFGRPLD